MSPAEARLKEAPSEMTEGEWSQRVNLAACYRLIAHYGWDDLVDTHISARVPGPDHHFLINPYGLMFDEITASSLVKVDLDGNQLTKSPYSINPAGFTIHSAIHEVREEAGCGLHLPPPAAEAGGDGMRRDLRAATDIPPPVADRAAQSETLRETPVRLGGLPAPA